MSRINTKLKHKPEEVIPYIIGVFNEMSKSRRMNKIYLVGSYGRTPFEEWGSLLGKDFDFLIEAENKMKHTHLLGEPAGYHVDVKITTPFETWKIRRSTYNGSNKGIEIYPNTPDYLKPFLNEF